MGGISGKMLRVEPRLPVSDLEETIAFYTEILGFSVDSRWPAGEPTFAILGRGDVRIQFYFSDVPDEVGHATLSFDVTDAKAAARAIQDQVEIEWGPEVYWYGRRELGVRDPDGYLVILSEQTEDPATC